MVTRALFFIFSCTVALAGPWEDFVQSHRKVEASRNRWTLCLQPGLLVPAEFLADPDYQKLAAGGDWGIEVLGTAPAQDLQATQGAQWALLAPTGDVAGAGRGRPKGSALLDAVHASGALARFEAREAFLKDNPGQGEARSEALTFEMRLARARIASLDGQGKVRVPAWHPEPGAAPAEDRVSLAGADGDAWAGDLYRGVGAALEELGKVPGWYREGHALAARLALFDLGQSTALRGVFQGLAAEVGEQALADPDDPGLTELWMETLDGARHLPESLSGAIPPVPGAVFPPAPLLPLLLEPYRRRHDPAGELRLLADLTPQAPPDPLTPKGWEDHCELEAALLAHKAAALAASGSADQARAALDAAAGWGGARTAATAFLRRGPQAADVWRRLGSQAAPRGSHRPPMPPVPPPLRLTVFGRPAWLGAWKALRDASALALWSPGELRWETAAPEVHARLRARLGWAPGPRWALFQGDDLRATGDACPEPRALAGILAGQATPYLERLAQAIAQDPGHVAARRARFKALLARMPDRRLEPLLAEDAARAGLELPFSPREPWKPGAELWGAAAEAALPGLETLLRSWPSDTRLWRTWISWARFHPGRPSILGLARGLPHWFPGGDWRTALPYAVQRAVADELRAQGDFLQMREWFQACWDLLDHRPLRELRPWERAWYLERRAQEDTSVFRPLRDALGALGLHEQQIELEKAFGAMMGRDVSGSR